MWKIACGKFDGEKKYENGCYIVKIIICLTRNVINNANWHSYRVHFDWAGAFRLKNLKTGRNFAVQDEKNENENHRKSTIYTDVAGRIRRHVWFSSPMEASVRLSEILWFCGQFCLNSNRIIWEQRQNARTYIWQPSTTQIFAGSAVLWKQSDESEKFSPKKNHEQIFVHGNRTQKQIT